MLAFGEGLCSLSTPSLALKSAFEPVFIYYIVVTALNSTGANYLYETT